MPMPKGFKSVNGYATKTSLGGKTYHEISDEMQSKGFKMNHSTARNVFVNSLEKIAKNVTDIYQLDLDKNELNRIAKDPRFQAAIMSFMYEID
jgi:hypothetical protein